MMTFPISIYSRNPEPNILSNRVLYMNFTDGTLTDKSLYAHQFETIAGSTVYTASGKFGGALLDNTATNVQAGIRTFNNYRIIGFGTGDFTIQFWYLRNDNTDRSRALIALKDLSGNLICLYTQSSAGGIGKLDFVITGSTPIRTPTAPAAGVFHHVAFCRKGGVIRCFLNGSQVGGDQFNSTNFGKLWCNVAGLAGSNATLLRPIQGRIDDIEIRFNEALYWDGPFTPPGELDPNDN